MDKINKVMERLLQGERVEWKPLGDVTNYEQPGKYIVNSREFLDTPTNAHSTPVLTAGKTFILGYTNENEGIYRASEKPVIIFDDFTTDTRWIDFDFKIRSSTLKMITAVDEEIALQKFIFYWLEIQSSPEKGSNRRQWISNYAKKKIPIPPLHVQEEIVRILDTFTELTNELTKEQEARQTQYEYYRDKLLTFEDGEVEWVKLGDVAQYSNERIGLDEVDKNNYVSVDNLLQNKKGKSKASHLPGSGTLIKFKVGDILIGNIRPYLRKIWYADCDGGTNGDVLVIKNKSHKLTSAYLHQLLLQERFFEYNVQFSRGARMPRGDKSRILQYGIPIPSLEIQKQITDWLHRFELITNSITEGLPREIELRQQQYEYYRDLLLSFPKAA